jgi:hypothetical protein
MRPETGIRLSKGGRVKALVLVEAVGLYLRLLLLMNGFEFIINFWGIIADFRNILGENLRRLNKIFQVDALGNFEAIIEVRLVVIPVIFQFRQVFDFIFHLFEGDFDFFAFLIATKDFLYFQSGFLLFKVLKEPLGVFSDQKTSEMALDCDELLKI